MRYLFDLGHPAHVHYFKFIIKSLKLNGNEVIVTARNKDVTFALLESEKIKYTSRGKGANSTFGKLLYLIWGSLLLTWIGKRNKVDMYIGFGSPYAAFASFVNGKKSVILDDTENALLGQSFYRRFATTILSPDSFSKDFGMKHSKFKSFMELFYLHPEVFSSTVEERDENSIALLRFVGWNAAHDAGHNGISLEAKKRIVEKLETFGFKVYISSEDKLPDSLQKYALKINPADMHEFLSLCSLLVGESATMASEAAMLGVPAFYFDNEGRGYTDALQKKYDLVFNYNESDEAVDQAIAKLPEVIGRDRTYWLNQRELLLADNVNPNKFLLTELLNVVKIL
jgi:uncharacterized protein